MKGIVQLRGDFGNPSGTGLAKLTVDNLESADVAAGLTAMDTFADSLVTGDFTDCNVGDITVADKTIQFSDKPGAAVNVDRQLFVVYRKKTDDSIRRMTIPGVGGSATVLEDSDAGERLTTAAKATLEGYLDTLFGWTDEAVVLSGKVLQKA